MSCLLNWEAATLPATCTSGTSASRQARSVAQALSSTQAPMAIIRFLSSATRMNSIGSTRPSSSDSQRRIQIASGASSTRLR
jgi:hypothetical protein